VPYRFALPLLLAASVCVHTHCRAQQSPLNVVIVVYEDVYLLDFAGPMEVFHDAAIVDSSCRLRVVTASRDGKPVHAHTGLLVTPGCALADCARPDVLVIPGGDLDVGEKDTVLAAWIRETAPRCRIVLSVCTGAFILAKLGLLDGMKATTWHGALKGLAKAAPRCETVGGVRWTDNGRVITTAGISAGIDGALHVVSRLRGAATAQQTARYMDYEYWTGEAAVTR
jgi:transcriptional regulator GlxA family with amidase domain